MISEKDLLEGIAECQGQRNPNANTCLKLASFYTILDHIKKEDEPAAEHVYSYSSGPYRSDTEFGELIRSMDENEILEVMDELMTTLSVVQPRLYASVIRKLKRQQ